MQTKKARRRLFSLTRHPLNQPSLFSQIFKRSRATTLAKTLSAPNCTAKPPKVKRYISNRESSRDHTLHILRLVVEDADAVHELLPQMNGTAMDDSNESGSYDGSSSEDGSRENGTHAWPTREQMDVKSIEASLRAA